MQIQINPEHSQKTSKKMAATFRCSPGYETERYVNKVVNPITVIGATY